MTTTIRTRLTCSRCQTRLGAVYVYSRHTRRHYCPDLRACDRRKKRKGLL